MFRKNSIKRRVFFVGAIIVLTVWACKDIELDDCVRPINSNRGNVLFIIADDLGLDSSPCYDHNSILPNMPTLESLCNDGVVFDNVWSSPMCAPTRASLITGKHGVRTGVVNIPDQNTLPVSEQTIQQYIEEKAPNTYCQSIIGKWHLNNEVNDNDYPRKMGIPYFDGLIRGTLDSYYKWRRTVNGNTKNSNTYATTANTNAAIRWIEDRGTSPWFLWLAYNAPHTPFHLPPNDLHSQGNLPVGEADIEANPVPYYHAMLEAMDTEMGRLLSSIDPTVLENTTIIFISDNGTPKEVLREPFLPNQSKGTLFQGGINVPMVVAGNGVTRRGEREQALVSTTDLFPTIAELTSTGGPVINDGYSFKGLLAGETIDNKRHYNYTDMVSGWAVSDMDYKLIVKIDGQKRFYDLVNDPYEKENIIGTTVDSLEQKISELEWVGITIRQE